jgi:hypothetical protein
MAKVVSLFLAIFLSFSLPPPPFVTCFDGLSGAERRERLNGQSIGWTLQLLLTGNTRGCQVKIKVVSPFSPQRFLALNLFLKTTDFDPPPSQSQHCLVEIKLR